MIEIMVVICGNMDCRIMYWCNIYKICCYIIECMCFVSECSGVV